MVAALLLFAAAIKQATHFEVTYDVAFLAFSPQDEFLVVSGKYENNENELIEIKSSRVVLQTKGTLLFSADNRYAASHDAPWHQVGKIKLTDLTTLKTSTLDVEGSDILFSPTGKELAVIPQASLIRAGRMLPIATPTIFIYDMATGKSRSLYEYANAVKKFSTRPILAFTLSKWKATGLEVNVDVGGNVEEAFLVDSTKDTAAHLPHGYGGESEPQTLLVDGSQINYGEHGNVVRRFEMNQEALLFDTQELFGTMSARWSSPRSSNWIAVYGVVKDRSRAEIWMVNAVNGAKSKFMSAPCRALDGPFDPVTCVALSSDASKIAYLDFQNRRRVHVADVPKEKRTLTPH